MSINSRLQCVRSPWVLPGQEGFLYVMSTHILGSSWGSWTSWSFCSSTLSTTHPSEVTQLCPTLCDPVDCSLPGSSIHGIFQARMLEWVAIAFSRRSSRPRDWNRVSRILGRRFTIWATREVPKIKGITTKTSNKLFWELSTLRSQKSHWVSLEKALNFLELTWHWYDFSMNQSLSVITETFHCTQS